VGGIESVTLGDEEAKSRGCQKTILERRAPPTFPIVLEMRDRSNWVAHSTEQSVDALLLNKVPRVQVSSRHGTRVGFSSVIMFRLHMAEQGHNLAETPKG
jgi:hypothetical protein